MRNGVIQDWGLVEFFDAQEAEQTQERMNGYNLGGRNIRWEFEYTNLSGNFTNWKEGLLGGNSFFYHWKKEYLVRICGWSIFG